MNRRAANTSEGFTERVMAAIAGTSPPTPTRSFLSAIRVHAGRSAAAALLVAWHLATVRDWRVAPQVRVRSLALVLGVASVLATGSLAAAAAVHVVAPGLVVSAPAADPARSPADDPRPVVREPADAAGPSRGTDPTPNPIEHLVPIAPVPHATPDANRTRNAADGGKHPAATHHEGDDGAGDDAADDGAAGTRAGDNGSDDHDRPSATPDAGDEGGSDQPGTSSEGAGGSDGSDEGSGG